MTTASRVLDDDRVREEERALDRAARPDERCARRARGRRALSGSRRHRRGRRVLRRLRPRRVRASPSSPSELWASSDRWHRTVLEFPLPTVAAVNGGAYGGGFDLAVMCDLRVARDTARFAHPEHAFTQVVYAPLHDLVGGAVARDLALTGRRIDAAEALAPRAGESGRAARRGASREARTRRPRRSRVAPRDVLVRMKAKILPAEPGIATGDGDPRPVSRREARLASRRGSRSWSRSGLAYFLALGMRAPRRAAATSRTGSAAASVAVGIAVGALFVGAVLLRPYAGRLGDRLGRRVLIIVGAAIVGRVDRRCTARSSRCAFLVARPRAHRRRRGRVLRRRGDDDHRPRADATAGARRSATGRSRSTAGWRSAPRSVRRCSTRRASPRSGWSPRSSPRSPPLLARRARARCRGPTPRPRDELGLDQPRRARRRARVLFSGLIALAAFTAFVPLYVDDIGLQQTPTCVFLVYGGLVLVVRIFGARLPDTLGGRTAGDARARGERRRHGDHGRVGHDGRAPRRAPSCSRSARRCCTRRCCSSRSEARRRAERGSVVGTFSSFFDLSQGLGSVLVGVVAAATSYRGAFALGAVCAALGLVRLASGTRRVATPGAGSTRPARSPPSIPARDVAARDERLPAEGRRDPVLSLRAVAAAARRARRRSSRPRTPARRRGTPRQPFRVERTRERFLFPTPLVGRPHRRARARGRRRRGVPRPDAAARARRAAPRRRALRRRRARRRGHGLRVGCRCSGRRARRVLRGAAGIVAAGRYPRRERRHASRGARCRRSSSRRASTVDRFRPLDADERRGRAPGASGSIPTPRSWSASAGSCPARASTCSSTRSPALPGVQVAIAGAGRDAARLRAPGAPARRAGRDSSDASTTTDLPRSTAAPTCSRCCAATAGAGSRPRASGSCSSRPRRAASRRSPGAAAVSHEAVVDGETGFVVEPQDVDARPRRDRPAARRRDRCGAVSATPRTRARVLRELSYDALAARLAPLAAGDLSARSS